jgi:Mn-dependent DtxR family transcriptional regulator
MNGRIDVTVVHLSSAQEARRRLRGKNYIETIPARGYVLREPSKALASA